MCPQEESVWVIGAVRAPSWALAGSGIWAALPLLERGVGGHLLPVAGSGRLHGAVHAMEQRPLLARVPLALPEEAPSPQGVPHRGAASGQEQSDAQGPAVSAQVPQHGQAGRVQEEQWGTVDDHCVEASRRGHQRSPAARWVPVLVLSGLSLTGPGLQALLLPPGRHMPHIQPREAVEGSQEEVLVGLAEWPCEAEHPRPRLGN